MTTRATSVADRRHRLIGAGTPGLHRRSVRRTMEAASSGSITDWQTGRCAAPAEHILDRERLPLGAPAAEAALEHPEARDVAQHARGAGDAALVGEVVGQGRRA